MMHVRVSLGAVGEAAVVSAAVNERLYRLTCIEAVKLGANMPMSDSLASIVASYVRHWAVQTAERTDTVAAPDPPVYHVPPRGWTLMRNGVSFVVVPKGAGRTRACAVFESPLTIEVDEAGMLVLSKQPNGWLATFKEVNDG